MTQNKPLQFLFIHIPKNAGTSITDFLVKRFKYNINTFSTIDKELNIHDTLFQLETINNINKNTKIFSVCRNPYRRSYSYYKYFIKEKMIISTLSFGEYLKEIDNMKLKDFRQDCYTQGWWLITKNNLNKKIYYFENLLEFEKDFQCNLPHLNKTNFNIDLYTKEYTEDAKKRVLDIYYDDFLTFNYDKSWETSIPQSNYTEL